MKDINGERNGKGKEYYYNGILKFEGEYLNGKKWNRQGFNPKGEKEYEIKEGNGFVKEYNNYIGELSFEGEYSIGTRWNGKGKEYYDNYDRKKNGNDYDDSLNETKKMNIEILFMLMNWLLNIICLIYKILVKKKFIMIKSI